MTAATHSYCVLPSAGTDGLMWAPVCHRLPATVLPVPDEPDVQSMAAVLRPQLEELPRPRTLVGSSLGAMVALELAHSVAVDGLVLIAAGFGIHVGDELIAWADAQPPELIPRIARNSFADRDDAAMVAEAIRDFETRGPAVLLRHIRALAAYEPEPLRDPPPTIVLWGEHDHSVPLRDHAELAVRCRGVVAPIAGAGHVPFFEQPAQVAHWIRAASSLGAQLTTT